MSRHVKTTRSTQAGVTLVEVVLVLAIAAIMGVALAQNLVTDRKSLVMATIAGRITEVRAAADKYIRDNFSSLEAATANGPVAVSPATLMQLNYLPASFSNENEYHQALTIYIRNRAPGVLESIVAATGGNSMTVAEGGQVARLLKSSGGFVPVDSDTATGTKGGWQVNLASFVPNGFPRPNGHAIAYSLNRRFDGPSGALMRDATGNPIDNRMNTDLDMNGNRILNVKDLVVGGETVNNNIIRNISDLASVNCQEGQAITKVGSAFMCVSTSGVPSNGVVAVLGQCPSGWRQDNRFAGRILIGSGTYQETVGGVTNTYSYSMGDTGGQNSRVLTADQLPEHRHRMFADAQQGYDNMQIFPDAAPNRGASGNSSGASYNIGGNSRGQDATLGQTGAAGGNQPVDTRQPYYAVNYCLKN